MLSETDIHYITGFLYLTANTEDITVTLGEKVLDEASESERDVDIIIATAKESGLIAAEVKDEARPLHVGIVEGLCQKFSDMPSITDRSIVSASGFTEPAVRKASAHDVKCLRFVKGHLPKFKTVDISHLEEFPVSYLEWRSGPEVRLIPEHELSSQQVSELSGDRPVKTEIVDETSPRTLLELVNRITAAVTFAWAGPNETNGPTPVSIPVDVADAPMVVLPSGPITIRRAEVTGVVEWVNFVVPREDACYLEALDGAVVAGTVLLKIRTGLLGVAVSPESQRLRYFHIPDSIRNVRPIRRVISEPRDA